MKAVIFDDLRVSNNPARIGAESAGQLSEQEIIIYSESEESGVSGW